MLAVAVTTLFDMTRRCRLLWRARRTAREEAERGIASFHRPRGYEMPQNAGRDVDV